MVEFAAPLISDKHPTTQFLWQDCPRQAEDALNESQSVANAYEAIYVGELLDNMKSHKMVALLHFNNIDTRGYRKAWQTARKLKCQLETYEPVMVSTALKNTPWENLMFFLKGTNANDGQRFLFSADIDAANFLQFEKKIAGAYLMATVVENRILDREQLQQLAKMPPKEMLLGETLAILNSPAQKMTSLLQNNQQELSRNLSQYIKDSQ